jgi:hypothetical protein
MRDIFEQLASKITLIKLILIKKEGYLDGRMGHKTIRCFNY